MIRREDQLVRVDNYEESKISIGVELGSESWIGSRKRWKNEHIE